MFKVFTVYDSAADYYSPPFYTRTRGEAVRAVALVLRDPEHVFSRHTSDYSLWCLGTWDDQAGEIVMNKERVCALNTLERETNG